MHRRALAAATASAALILVTLSPPTGVATGADLAEGPAPAPSAQVVHDWQRTLLRTVYAENMTPIPVGTLYLGFTSLAMHAAVTRALERGASPEAAAAVAAHDVLVEYFPSSAANLAADLDASLAAVPDGAAKTKGTAIGARAAERMIEDRANDGRGDPSIVYDRDPAPGVWQPTTAPFLAPWLGFVEPLVLRHRVQLDGPDSIRSAAYAFDFLEVKRVGVAGTTQHRTEEQAFLAAFYNFNPPLSYGNALLAELADAPLSLRATSRLFARMHAAMADSLIQCWRYKYAGFWRPFQGIQQADTDGNPATIPDPTWTPLIVNPPYPEYPSGHGCVTSATMETIRRTLGETTELTLHSVALNTDRTYSTLGELEFDAFNARIWGGVHFRDGMDDAYFLGHKTARQVMRHLR
jgi:hypothetical protein